MISQGGPHFQMFFLQMFATSTEVLYLPTFLKLFIRSCHTLSFSAVWSHSFPIDSTYFNWFFQYPNQPLSMLQALTGTLFFTYSQHALYIFLIFRHATGVFSHLGTARCHAHQLTSKGFYGEILNIKTADYFVCIGLRTTFTNIYDEKTPIHNRRDGLTSTYIINV